MPRKPEWTEWNHNDHYHRFLLAQVSASCGRALDVGCGAGRFALRLADRAERVIALDRDPSILEAARRASSHPRVAYLEGDLLEVPLERGSFDFISCIAAIHHMPFSTALIRLRGLLASGGTLAIIGLYRPATIADYAYYAAVVPVDLTVGMLRHRRERTAPPLPMATVRPPAMTLSEVVEAASALPGATVRRHMYYRYSLVYRGPAAD